MHGRIGHRPKEPQGHALDERLIEPPLQGLPEVVGGKAGIGTEQVVDEAAQRYPPLLARVVPFGHNEMQINEIARFEPIADRVQRAGTEIPPGRQAYALVRTAGGQAARAVPPSSRSAG